MADDRNQDQGQGRGWHSDPEGHAKAGKKGGEATSKSHGEQFYQQIGRKGGKSRNRRGEYQGQGNQNMPDRFDEDSDEMM